MKIFTLVWAGQVLTLLGSAIVHFALGIWAWNQTGLVTPLALLALFSLLPLTFISPLAEVLVDRWSRKRVLLFCFPGAALVTLAVLILLVTGQLKVWHLSITSAAAGTFGAFCQAANESISASLVPKKYSARVGRMMALAESAVGIVAPILVAALLDKASFKAVLLVDLAAHVVALVLLLLVKIPESRSKTAPRAFGASLKEWAYGFRFMLKRPGLRNLQIVDFLGKFLSAIALFLLLPLILAGTNNQVSLLAAVLSVGAIGSLVGGIILAAWGRSGKRIHGVLISSALAGAGITLFGLSHSLLFWMAAVFLAMTALAIANGEKEAIWRSKVSRNGQAQVSSTRRLLSQFAAFLALAVAGPLADQVFSPVMSAPDSALLRLTGSIIGSGPGAGTAALISFSGILLLCVGLGAYRNRLVLHVEELVPDHDEDK